jgi:hypothetical protein
MIVMKEEIRVRCESETETERERVRVRHSSSSLFSRHWHSFSSPNSGPSVVACLLACALLREVFAICLLVALRLANAYGRRARWVCFRGMYAVAKRSGKCKYSLISYWFATTIIIIIINQSINQSGICGPGLLVQYKRITNRPITFTATPRASGA